MSDDIRDTPMTPEALLKWGRSLPRGEGNKIDIDEDPPGGSMKVEELKRRLLGLVDVYGYEMRQGDLAGAAITKHEIGEALEAIEAEIYRQC